MMFASFVIYSVTVSEPAVLSVKFWETIEELGEKSLWQHLDYVLTPYPRFLLVVLVHRRHPEVALYEINSVLGARVP